MRTTAVEWGRLLRKTFGLNPNSVSPADLDKAIQKRMAALGIRQKSQYGTFLKTARRERNALVEAVELSAGAFHEDQSPYLALRKWVVTHWLPNHANQILKALCLPCASGEEAYSVAICLSELGLNGPQFRVEAVDISAEAIQRASEGWYSSASVRPLDRSVRDRYFQKVGSRFRVSDSIRRTVHFTKTDFKTPLDLKSGYHVVFARSVMRYFLPSVQQLILRDLRRLLTPGGFLVVGSTRVESHPEHGNTSQWVRSLCRKSDPAHAPRVTAAPLEGNRSTVDFQKIQLKEAGEMVAEGRFEEASMICLRILNEHRASVQAIFLLGCIAEAEGRSFEAREFYRRALYLQPSHRKAQEHLTRMMRVTRTFPAA